MAGINVPIPARVAYCSFGGWRQSLLGDLHVGGVEGVRFYTRTEVLTRRGCTGTRQRRGFTMPRRG
ncbi:MAG: hypothetical protein IT515_14685 [Burkholderiales bacterium]|nr:hypothetical protein [Burkholderiales bacterium]